jgi:hypothetical protein
VPHPTDQSDASTLPDPELNPLLNPLLAAHMGRWAEVYFTNPPEKREQAVTELLRQLENISPNSSPPEPAALQSIPGESAGRKTEAAESPTSSATALEPAVPCKSCAYNNSAEQRFCGMCGAPLHVVPETHVPQAAEAPPITGASWSEYSPGDNSIENAIGPAVSSMDTSSGRDDRELSWLRPERDFPVFAAESDPPPSSYRIYVGAAVIVLLIVVGYMAWRGTEALSGTAPAQSAPSQFAPAKSNPPAQPMPDVSTQPTAAATALPTSAAPAIVPPASRAPASRTQPQSQPDASPKKVQTVDARPAPRIVSVAASSSAIVTEQSGAEDMATAEKYLNGAQGVPRDSGEAALWLWRAVGKGNLAATMTLSDLFLRGDVLAKNCGQARVLLDAAAKKGSKAAAERLRNLPAFGCE